MSIRESVLDILADSVRAYTECNGGPIAVEKKKIKFKADRQTFTMTENGKDATLTRVYVCDLDNDCVILKPDDFGVRFFRKDSWNKACDYLILVVVNGKKYAIFVELKSSIDNQPDGNDNHLVIDGNEDNKKEQQLLGAAELWNYIKLIVKKKTDSSELDDYDVRMWVLYESVKSRSPTQSQIMTTVPRRTKSKCVQTKQVHDAETISVHDLL